jgi:hypothetical protein
MALANVAFLAAMSGRRVLVMDWDLEAPGLSYYFRGQLDRAESRSLKEAPGVMNIVCEWSSAIQHRHTIDTSALLDRFQLGLPFAECIRPLVSSDRLPEGAALEIIGAGSQSINMPSAKPYEQALAEFSWPSFLNDQAGGIVLQSLRQWAKLHYDYIFIDSRTGMADVASICTMQMPDVVALCFVMNRQNIDGVARVAGVIRSGRNEEVRVHAVPTRLAREGTPEEADARARAIAELVKTGGFSPEAAREDLENLGIRQADNVPFYETLTPFVAINPALDLLTLNYASMGSRLLEQTLRIPELESDFVELVRRRLAPHHATLDYVAKLRSMEPERAVAELADLIESAINAALDGDALDDGYISALVDASFSIADLSTSQSELPVIQSRALDLLRTLAGQNRSKWNPVLLTAVRKYLELFSYNLDHDEELAILEELDGLLAEESTTSARLARIEFRRKAAALFLIGRDFDGTMQTVGEIATLLRELDRSNAALAKDQQNAMFWAEIDIAIITSDVDAEKEQPLKAYQGYEQTLDRLNSAKIEKDSSEFKSFLYTVLCKLASAGNPNIGAFAQGEYSIAAAQTGRQRIVVDFAQLAAPVIRARSEDQAFRFLQATLGSSDTGTRRMFSNYFGRQARLVTELADTMILLCRQVTGLSQGSIRPVLEPIAEIFAMALYNLGRRRSTLSKTHAAQIGRLSDELLVVLQGAGLEAPHLAPLAVAHQDFVQNRPRAPMHNDLS